MPYKSDAGVKITEGGSLAKTYGDAPFSLSASAADEGTFGDWGATGWTWTSSDTDVAEVDNTGKVTIKNASRTPVTLTATYESDTTLGSAEIELAVNKREITFTSGSAEREYNGNPPTNDEVLVGEDGFVPGEGATYEVTGSQTIVGNSDNMFTYVFNDNTNADNYKVSTILGTLKVVSRTDKYKISPQANSKTVDYDGFAWEVTGFETDTYEVDGNTYTVSGLEAYANEKEVGEHPVNVTGTAVVKDSKGNDVTSEFEVTPKPGKLIIKNSMIQYTVTFKVENGEWNDGGSDDKTVTLSRKENEDLLLTLKAEDIPGVGNKPSSGFKAGEWDITPSTEMVISRDRVFTYTYDQKAPVSHTVTFKVENGTWNDGTTEDKKIIVSGYEGDTLKLSADQIPLVGTKPDSEHKKGKWDVTPNIATEITGDMTYTYTYADKKMIKYTVTFKVENGEWDDGGSEDKVVTLSREEAEDLLLLLKNEDIPAVGNKPSNGFKAGGWDTAPRTDLVISEDKTYTYTYAQKASISQTVTFKVENGTWSDGTSEDKIVTLSGYEGDILKLSADQIPAAGDKPGDGFTEGKWDVVPVTDKEVTQDVVYTYTYAEKEEVVKPEYTIEKITLNKTVSVGQQVLFEIVVRNTGKVDIDDIVISESEIEGLVFDHFIDYMNVWINDGMTWRLNTSLHSGEVRSLYLAYNTTKSGNITNIITSGNLTSNATVEVNDNVKPVTNPDIAVAAEIVENPIFIGNTTLVKITVTNTGDVDLDNVFVDLMLNGGLIYGSMLGNWTYDNNRFNLNTVLRVGESSTFYVSVKALTAGNLSSIAYAGFNNTQISNSTFVIEVLNETAPANKTDNITDNTQAKVVKGAVVNNSAGNPLLLVLLSLMSLLFVNIRRKN